MGLNAGLERDLVQAFETFDEKLLSWQNAFSMQKHLEEFSSEGLVKKVYQS